MKQNLKDTMRKYAYQIMICILLVCLAVVFLLNRKMSQGGKNKDPLVRTDFMLDTVVSVSLYDCDDETVLDGAFELCSKYENLISTTRQSSDIYRMNHRADSEQRYVPDKDVLELIKKGLYYSELSDGAFDITVEPLTVLWDFHSESPHVPSKTDIESAVANVDYRNIRIEGDSIVFLSGDTRIDLGAIAKGYIADKMKEYLLNAGVRSAIINLGGNIVCVGKKLDGTPFDIGVQRPFANYSETAGIIKTDDKSVVSSGIYERCFMENSVLYHHILNPKTGYPYDNGITDVTVVGPSSCDCDALSTVCFVLGEEKGMEIIDGMDGYGCCYIFEDGSIKTSENSSEIHMY